MKRMHISQFPLKVKNSLRQLSHIVLSVIVLASCTNQSVANKNFDQANYKAFDAKQLQSDLQQAISKAYITSVGLIDETVIEEYGKVVPEAVFSGVIVSAEGHILTVAHAINPDAKYRVILSDGTHLKAKGLGQILGFDGALAKITEEGEWSYAEMGWSSTLQVDEPCISISYAGGYGDPGRGAIVRFGRIVDPFSDSYGYIQSTCLMEPGDSGGPLFDINGRVIALHSHINFEMNQNYDVPVDGFRRYWTEYNTSKTYQVKDLPKKGFDLGMTLLAKEEFNSDELPEEERSEEEGSGAEQGEMEMPSIEEIRKEAAEYLAELEKGVEIIQLDKNGLAAKAGLRKGDRIIQTDGNRSLDSLAIDRIIYAAYRLKKPTVNVMVKRDERTKTFTLTIPKWVADIETPPAMTVRAIAGFDNLSGQFSQQESQLDDAVLLIKSDVRGENRSSLVTLLDITQSSNSSLLVGKSSMVGDVVSVTLDNGQSVSATVVTRDPKNDLVLLKIAQRLQGGVKLQAYDQQTTDFNKIGRFLLSPNPTDEGKVSVISSVNFESPISQSSGFLGIRPDDKDGKVIIARVFPNTPAREAKLKRKDIIIDINDQVVNSPEKLISLLKYYAPGDQVVISVKRGNENMDISVTLGERQDGMSHIADALEFGKSTRRDGFSKVFTHDAVLKPSDCGGGVFDINGHFVGINIARYSRTQSYAIPASVVDKFVQGAL